ncbi:MAG: LITAF-like zinc ribbon domain-containing protein [Chloroflexota bacterium]|nr:LITAF-like zinc ribbon domain-containing protein [Chloroflexota bacterium]
MNSKDFDAFQQAIQLARAGQTKAAYEQFCILVGNYENRSHPDLLLWIAETTPSYEEAQRAINEASSIAPHHPGLPQAHAQLARRQQPTTHMHMHMHLFPQVGAYSCPFCGTSVEPIIENKVSTAGWVIFFILILGIITFELCWLGLLLRENVVECPVCNGNLKGYI